MTQELIAKLESASEGSRELDALIWAHYQPEKVKVTDWNEPYGDRSGRSQVEFTLPPKRTRCVTSDRGQYRHAEPITTSIDAALALAERVLPGWCFWVDTDGNADAWNTKHVDSLKQSFVARQPALAICAAILRASAAEGAGS